MAYPYPYSGPIAPYNNLPIQPQYYAPRFFFISGITLGVLTTVTTTVNHDYVVGQTIRLIIPPQFGCRLLNEKQANVLAIPNPNQVVIGINSLGFDAFTSSSATTQPQILAIGDVNTGATNATGNINLNTNVPGSFINISP